MASAVKVTAFPKVVDGRGGTIDVKVTPVAGGRPMVYARIELATGVPVVYRLGADSRPISVEILG